MSFHRRMIDTLTANLLVALKPGEALTFIGRCPEPRCKHGVRVELPGIMTFAPDEPGYRFGLTSVPPRDFTVPEGHRWMGTGGYLSSLDQMERMGNERDPGKFQCPDHLLLYAFKELRSVLITTSACGAACEEATGSDCKCSCGGANHGARAA